MIEVQRNLLSEEGVGKRILRMEMPGYVARFSQEEVAMLRGVRWGLAVRRRCNRGNWNAFRRVIYGAK